MRKRRKPALYFGPAINGVLAYPKGKPFRTVGQLRKLVDEADMRLWKSLDKVLKKRGGHCVGYYKGVRIGTAK